MYTDLALQQVDASFISSHSSRDNQPLFAEYANQEVKFVLPSKICCLAALDMHHEVIEKVDEFMNLCATTDSDVDAEQIIVTRMLKANAHLELGEWTMALDLFTLLYEDCKEQHQHQQNCYAIASGISRAQYELHNYHDAIGYGCRAVRGNRFRAGVHKYIALSQMKMGDIAAAKKTITRGILHEQQWNEENRKENKEVLRMILAKEETQNTKSKSRKKGKKKNRGKKVELFSKGRHMEIIQSTTKLKKH